MNYIIDEEELRDLGRVIYNIGYDRNSNREVKIEIDEFLKFKQSVELVKHLNRDEVEKAINDNITEPVIEIDDDGNKTQIGKELNYENCITTICKLAISQIK